MAAPRTTRENVLLLVLAGVAAGGYFIWRYRPLKAEITQLSTEAKEAVDKRQGIMISPEPAQDAQTLSQQLAQLKEQVDLERTRVDELQRQFAPTDGDLQQLKVEIASLAPKCGVKIKQSIPYKGDTNKPRPAVTAPSAPAIELPPDFPEALRNARNGTATKKKTDAAAGPKFPAQAPGPFVDLAAIETITGRQAEHVMLEGSFNGLRKFLVGLDHLRWRVTVVRLEEVLGDQRPDGLARTPTLRTTLILGL